MSYKDLWLFLNRTGLGPMSENLTQDQSTCKFSEILEYFTQNTHLRIVNLRAVSAADRDYLAGEKISVKYLIRNLEKTMKGRHLDAKAFQLDAVRSQAVYALCPFTGKRIESHHSLLANINVIFYRFESQRVFYVVTAGIGYGFKKSALYFPEEELVVTTGDDWGFEKDDLIELKARMVFSFRICQDYLANRNRQCRKTALCIGYYHFAHHLWNELSGVHRLHKKGLLPRVDKFLVLREPLGAIGEIFPEISKDKIERISGTDQLFNEILVKGYFAVRLGDDFIPADLISRVYNVALKNCPAKTLAKVREARKICSTLLWVGIRVGNRTWDDQVVGLSSLIHSLSSKIPKLGVVFDGFSLPADRSAQSADQQDYSAAMNRENAVVNGVIKRLQEGQGAPEIYNLVGSSIYEANVWAHAIDVYLSPYGTLQHKVGWLTSKPGIIHTNQNLLKHPAKYIWAAIENAIKPQYVRPIGVSDIPRPQPEEFAYNQLSDASESGAGVLAANNRIRGNPEFNNYTVDWKMLCDDLLNLIEKQKIGLRLTPATLVNGAKRRVWMTLQSVTSSWDSSKL